MKALTIPLLLLSLLFPAFPVKAQAMPDSLRARVIILTDIENEPDDTQSLIRFLTYANCFDIEGLVATTSVHQKNRVATEKIKEILDAYGGVRQNLLLHEPGFPQKSFLLENTKGGYPDFGMLAVGQGKDSEGSDHIIRVVDKSDPRPVWIPVWGGANCLAQALWKVRATRTPEDVDQFVSKIRVYTISDQDDSGPWIRRNFPDLFYIVSPGFHAAGAYHHATWSGIAGDKFHGRFTGPDFSLVDNPWLDRHVRSKGPLGEKYPITKFMMEGDTPSFLNLIPNGLNNPERPDFGGWGGRYERYQPITQKWFYEPETRPVWSDASDEVMGADGHYHTSNKATIWRWREAVQHDFSARMDWTVKPYKDANHPPLAVSRTGTRLSVKAGETVTLSGEGSSDPDGDALSYRWIYYGEAGSYTSKDQLKIQDADKMTAKFIAPKVTKPETLHIILAVTDSGSPALTRYQRIVVAIYPI